MADWGLPGDFADTGDFADCGLTGDFADCGLTGDLAESVAFGSVVSDFSDGVAEAGEVADTDLLGDRSGVGCFSKALVWAGVGVGSAEALGLANATIGDRAMAAAPPAMIHLVFFCI